MTAFSQPENLYCLGGYKSAVRVSKTRMHVSKKISPAWQDVETGFIIQSTNFNYSSNPVFFLNLTVDKQKNWIFQVTLLYITSLACWPRPISKPFSTTSVISMSRNGLQWSLLMRKRNGHYCCIAMHYTLYVHYLLSVSDRTSTMYRWVVYFKHYARLYVCTLFTLKLWLHRNFLRLLHSFSFLK